MGPREVEILGESRPSPSTQPAPGPTQTFASFLHPNLGRGRDRRNEASVGPYGKVSVYAFEPRWVPVASSTMTEISCVPEGTPV